MKVTKNQCSHIKCATSAYNIEDCFFSKFCRLLLEWFLINSVCLNIVNMFLCYSIHFNIYSTRFVCYIFFSPSLFLSPSFGIASVQRVKCCFGALIINRHLVGDFTSGSIATNLAQLYNYTLYFVCMYESILCWFARALSFNLFFFLYFSSLIACLNQYTFKIFVYLHPSYNAI